MPESLAVDQSTGDLLVVDATAGTLSRFKPNGEPAPFSALGSNVIDGKRGLGGKTLAECETAPEAASCDETPQNGLTFGKASEVQVAVDNSGGVASGDIYLTQGSKDLVDIFASSGHYLGQLKEYEGPTNEVQKFANPAVPYTLSISGIGTTGTIPTGKTGALVCTEYLQPLIGVGNCTGSGLANLAKTITFVGALAGKDIPSMEVKKASEGSLIQVAETTTNGGTGPLAFGEACGVAVDSAGAVYVGDFTKGVHKFVPSANPATTHNSIANFTGVTSPCSVAAGAAGSAGFIFVNKYKGTVSRLNSTTGAVQYVVSSATNTTEAVNPASGNVITASGSVATEYEAGATEAVEKSELTAKSAIEGVAFSKTGGDVYISRSGDANVEVFGPPVSTPTVVTNAATGIGVTKATANGSVDAESTMITECEFEYGTTTAYGSKVACAEAIPADSKLHPTAATLTGLEPETTYHYRVVAANAAGVSEGADRTFTTGRTAITEAATAVTATTATLNGSVNPVGKALTECKFEYGTTTAYGSSKPCTPAAGSIEADFQSHSVSAGVTELMENTTYHFRIVATRTGGAAVDGEDETFTTIGAPQITEELPLSVEKETATLRAKVDPSGSPTNYRFEWGVTTAYGNQVPVDFEPVIGSGATFVPVVANLSGLQLGTQYHFRVVATNSSGTTDGPDQTLETLDSCGLPDDRCFELVSPPDKRPLGSLSTLFQTTLSYQGADDGESVEYTINGGLANATTGGEVVYVARRGSGGWSSTQASPPSLVSSPNGSRPSYVHYYNPNVTCGFVSTPSPLNDEVPQVDRENEVTNLYRRNEDGSFTLITNTAPVNPTGETGFGTYLVGGSSPDCSRVFFTSQYEFIPGAGGLYEWNNGVLRDAGVLPDGTLAPKTPLVGDFSSLFGSRINAVADDGIRVFFTSTSDQGVDKGKQAVFVHSSQKTVDVSQSTTSTVPLGATYEIAAEDGSQVFFTSNLGLAGPAGNGPQEQCLPPVKTACDLYDYEVESGRLVDLTTDNNPSDAKGAVVRGVVGVSRDGSYIYFAAEGQLVAGRGKSYAENAAAPGGANIYLFHEGQLHYVATVSEYDLKGSVLGGHAGPSVLVKEVQAYDAWVTPSGENLLFESRANVDGYESDDKSEAYLYSAKSESLQCVSCRAGGQPPVEFSEYQSGVLPGATSLQPEVALHYGRPMSDDGKKIFFTSHDVLAPGAVEGGKNIYEWDEGQRSLITTIGEGEKLVDTSSTGSDVFFTTSERLVGQDFDNQPDLYDARVGGGFAVPEAAPEPCDPNLNCQEPVGSPGSLGSLGSAAFSGPGNLASSPFVPAVSKKKPKTITQIRAEKLASALKACRGKPKSRRALCERQARKKYGKDDVARHKSKPVGKSNREKKAGR